MFSEIFKDKKKKKECVACRIGKTQPNTKHSISILFVIVFGRPRNIPEA
jgi:hypothetical protein